MELNKLKERIQDAIILINSSDVESLTVGISELESIRPDVQEYINANPKDPEGHLEISKTYQIHMFIAMKLDSFNQNDKMKAIALMMKHMNTSTEYAKKAKSHLEEFIKLGCPDPRMIDSAKKIIQMLENVINRQK